MRDLEKSAVEWYRNHPADKPDGSFMLQAFYQGCWEGTGTAAEALKLKAKKAFDKATEVMENGRINCEKTKRIYSKP